VVPGGASDIAEGDLMKVRIVKKPTSWDQNKIAVVVLT
jgi:hypothetical protein